MKNLNFLAILIALFFILSGNRTLVAQTTKKVTTKSRATLLAENAQWEKDYEKLTQQFTEYLEYSSGIMGLQGEIIDTLRKDSAEMALEIFELNLINALLDTAAELALLTTREALDAAHEAIEQRDAAIEQQDRALSALDAMTSLINGTQAVNYDNPRFFPGGPYPPASAPEEVKAETFTKALGTALTGGDLRNFFLTTNVALLEMDHYAESTEDWTIGLGLTLLPTFQRAFEGYGHIQSYSAFVKKPADDLRDFPGRHGFEGRLITGSAGLQLAPAIFKDEDQFRLVMRAGLSTATDVSDDWNTGLGLEVGIGLAMSDPDNTIGFVLSCNAFGAVLGTKNSLRPGNANDFRFDLSNYKAFYRHKWLHVAFETGLGIMAPHYDKNFLFIGGAIGISPSLLWNQRHKK